MTVLEDNFKYVLRKAMKGCGLAPSEVAERAGVPEDDVQNLARGKFSAATAQAIAPVLGLDSQALARHPQYPDEPPLPPEVTKIVTPYGDLGVNAWVIRSADATLLFDTGNDEAELQRALRKHAVHRFDAVFITHGHDDHVAGLAAVTGMAARVFSPNHEFIVGTERIEARDALEIGGLRISALATEGHTPGALSYRIDGLSKPVCAVGDAIFAGSMGGFPDRESFLLSRMRIRDQLLTLAPQTFLLPGHGPATTVATEAAHNPFFAGGAERNG